MTEQDPTSDPNAYPPPQNPPQSPPPGAGQYPPPAGGQYPPPADAQPAEQHYPGQQSYPVPQHAQQPPGHQQYGGYAAAPPPAPGYGYGQLQPQALPPGMHYDQEHDLVLPNGVELASVGRRVGAYFLAIPLAIVTLVIGYIIWGAIAWGRGTSPALQVLGMRVWRPAEQRPATWGVMALRDILGGIVQALFGIMEIVSFVMFLTGKQHKTVADHVGSTVVVYDPNKVLG